MAKLPVIQVATMNNGGSLAKDQDGFGLFHEHDNMGQFEMGFVLYEPMRGRCRTCAHRKEAGPVSVCLRWPADFNGDFEQVGLDDFCSRFEERENVDA